MQKLITDYRTLNAMAKKGAIILHRDGLGYVDKVLERFVTVGKNDYYIEAKYLDGCFCPYVLAETINWKRHIDDFILVCDGKYPVYIREDFYRLYHIGIGNPDDYIELPFSTCDIVDAHNYADALKDGFMLKEDFEKENQMGGGCRIYKRVPCYLVEKYEKSIQTPSISMGIFHK